MKLAVILIALLAGGLAQQTKLEGGDTPQPKVTNAQPDVRPAGDLIPTFDAIAKAAAKPTWVGYAVPAFPRSHFICCFDGRVSNWQKVGCCTGCKLERGSGNIFNSDGGTCVPREPASHVMVLYRLEGAKLTKIRAFTPDCGLDASGASLVWLTGVDSGQSLALLKRYLDPNQRKLAEHAMEAIALHRDPAAEKILESMLASSVPNKFREDVAFWLGSQRGREGYLTLQRIVRSDPDEHFREHATFVISEAKQPESIPELIRMAKEDRSTRVRGQALFWLAEKASRHAEGAITDAIENDPDREIKHKAVFALSQMPKEQGVPLLIKYARTHKDPKVRREAIFWLGQSEDPQALAFLEEVLLGK